MRMHKVTWQMRALEARLADRAPAVRMAGWAGRARAEPVVRVPPTVHLPLRQTLVRAAGPVVARSSREWAAAPSGWWLAGRSQTMESFPPMAALFPSTTVRPAEARAVRCMSRPARWRARGALRPTAERVARQAAAEA